MNGRRYHLISTPAEPARCRTCRAPILAGFDEGLWTRVDAEPIDPAGELDALVRGAWTYQRLADGSLQHRAAALIRSNPGRAAYAEHVCRRISPSGGTRALSATLAAETGSSVPRSQVDALRPSQTISGGKMVQHYNWRYMRGGKVLHALVSVNHTAAVCGQTIWLSADWYGTGTQGEYEAAAAMRRCSKCLKMTGGLL